MESLVNKHTVEQDKKEQELFKALDKGLDDLEQGRTVSHEEAMKIIRERIDSYDV